MDTVDTLNAVDTGDSADTVDTEDVDTGEPVGALDTVDTLDVDTGEPVVASDGTCDVLVCVVPGELACTLPTPGASGLLGRESVGMLWGISGAAASCAAGMGCGAVAVGTSVMRSTGWATGREAAGAESTGADLAGAEGAGGETADNITGP